MSAVLERKPIRKFLRERETLIPRKKLVTILNIDPLLTQEVRLPEGVSPKDAVEVVASSSWARGIAEGVCGGKYAGLTPGTRAYESCVYNVSHKVAARTLGLTWPLPTPPRRRRR